MARESGPARLEDRRRQVGIRLQPQTNKQAGASSHSARTRGTTQSCTGEWAPYNMEIVDKMLVPKDLPAGEWVLNWRMCDFMKLDSLLLLLLLLLLLIITTILVIIKPK